MTADELILGVNIALGAADLAACTAMDASHDGEITIDEVITATIRALNGC